jgi:hypothetical protein
MWDGPLCANVYPFTPLRGVTERDLLCFGGE